MSKYVLLSHDAPLIAPPPVYLKAPVARPPAAGCSDILHCQTRWAAGGAGRRQTAGGSAGSPRQSCSSPQVSLGPSCPSGSRPHRSCQSLHMADGCGDPPELKTGSLQGDRTQKKNEICFLLFSMNQLLFLLVHLIWLWVCKIMWRWC